MRERRAARVRDRRIPSDADRYLAWVRIALGKQRRESVPPESPSGTSGPSLAKLTIILRAAGVILAQFSLTRPGIFVRYSVSVRRLARCSLESSEMIGYLGRSSEGDPPTAARG